MSQPQGPFPGPGTPQAPPPSPPFQPPPFQPPPQGAPLQGPPFQGPPFQGPPFPPPPVAPLQGPSQPPPFPGPPAAGAPPQQWAPQPGWPGPPAPAAGPQQLPGPGLGTHLKRAIDWNLADIVPTPREEQALLAAGAEPRLHGMLVWRRSSLIVALPVLLLSVVLSFVDAADIDTSSFTGLGTVWAYLPSIGLLIVPLAAISVIARWTEMRKSSRTLVICWVVSIAIPLLTALIPLNLIVDLSSARAQVVQSGGDTAAFDAYVLSVRVAMAVAYAMILLPVVVTIPGGVLKGAARIKSLFPAASLPGWFLVGIAPFYSLFTIVVFVLIDQIIGNALLLVGVGLLAFSPWLFVIYRKTYGRPLAVAEARVELARASRIGGYLLVVGLALIAIYLLTAKVQGKHVLGADDNKSFFTYVQVLRTLAEVLSRMMVTTVVFSAVVLSMVFAEWRIMNRMRPDIRAEHDAQMHAIERYLASPGAPGESSWAQPSKS